MRDESPVLTSHGSPTSLALKNKSWEEIAMYQTNDYEGMTAETVTMPGFKADKINAYFAKPLGKGPFPAMVLIHRSEERRVGKECRL